MNERVLCLLLFFVYVLHSVIAFVYLSVSAGDAVGPAHGDAHSEAEASGERGTEGEGGAEASGPGEVQRRGPVPPQWRRTGTGRHYI